MFAVAFKLSANCSSGFARPNSAGMFDKAASVLHKLPILLVEN
jgi:hypothetical protein